MTKENKKICEDIVKNLRDKSTSIDELVEAMPKVLIEPWSYNGLTFLIRRKNGVHVKINWVAEDDDTAHILTSYNVWGL